MKKLNPYTLIYSQGGPNDYRKTGNIFIKEGCCWYVSVGPESVITARTASKVCYLSQSVGSFYPALENTL